MTSTTPTEPPQHKSEGIRVHAAADDDDDTVDSIETCFLKGSFREALTRANRFLNHHRAADPQGRPSSSGEDPSRAILQTRMDLGDTDLVRTIWVRWADQDPNDGDDNATDRVAAVALQSWYEVSRLLLEEEGPTRYHPRRSSSISSHHQKDGHRHLQPFLDTFTSPSTTDGDPNQEVVRQHPPPLPVRVMSVDLLVIWIQFCRCALQQIPVATSLTLQFLRHVRRMDPTAAAVRTSAAELLVRLMVDLLPRYYDTRDVEPLLEYLQAESPSLSIDELEARCASGNVLVSESDTEDAPALGNHKHVIQQCLRFCNTDEGNWPEWTRDSFGDCRVQLQAMLQDIYRQRNTEQSRIQRPGRDGDQRPGTDGPFTVVDHDHSAPARLILSKDHRFALSNWKVALVQWLRWIRQQKHAWTSAPPWHSIMALVQTRKQTLSMALLLLALAYGWRRHGQRLRGAVGRDAVTHVLGKFVQEILQALGVNV